MSTTARVMIITIFKLQINKNLILICLKFTQYNLFKSTSCLENLFRQQIAFISCY